MQGKLGFVQLKTDTLGRSKLRISVKERFGGITVTKQCHQNQAWSIMRAYTEMIAERRKEKDAWDALEKR